MELLTSANIPSNAQKHELADSANNFVASATGCLYAK